MANIDIYPEYVNMSSTKDISSLLSFLVLTDANSIKEIVSALYPMLTSSLSKSFQYNDVAVSRRAGHRYWTIIKLKNSFVNKSLLPEGSLIDFKDDRYREFPEWAAVCIKEGDTSDLHFCIFYENYSPNWNHEAVLLKAEPLTSLIEHGNIISSLDGVRQIDRTAQRLMRDHLNATYKDFVTEPDSDGFFKVYIAEERTGLVKCVADKSVDNVFRTIANDYQGHRNYRRPNAYEFVPKNDNTRVVFEDWKKTASGLTSDFDKFYGGGIVD